MILELDAANAIASAPYGRPNRAKLSRLEISRTWSGVGPFFGYVNSVLTSVWVSGFDMECKLIIDGDVSASAPLMLRLPFERVRESRLNMDPDPECEGWWRKMRLLRGSRSDDTDGRGSSCEWPVLLLGSGDEGWGTRGIGGEEVVVGSPSRELRGLNIDAKTDRRRTEPVPAC